MRKIFFSLLLSLISVTIQGAIAVGDTYEIHDFTYKVIATEGGNKGLEIIAYNGSDTDITIQDYIPMDNGTFLTVLSIADGAFENNTTLSTVSGMRYIKNIGDRAFYGCANLYEIELPNSLDTFGDEVFAYCANLEIFSIENEKDSKGAIKLGTKDGLLYFLDNDEVNPIEILACAQQALDYDESVNSLFFNYVTVINSGAFEGCYLFKGQKFFANTQEIGDRAFKDCTGITTFTLNEEIVSMGEGCFEGCTNLQMIYTSGDLQLTEIKNRTFYGCTSLKYIGHFPNISDIGGQAFENCTSLYQIYLSDMTSLKVIGNHAFLNCGELVLSTDVFPASLEKIGNSAFRNCKQICRGDGASLTFAKGSMLKEIHANAFRGCYDSNPYRFARLNFEFPEGLEYIGINSLAESDFSTDKSGSEIYIPASVITICEGAFTDARNAAFDVASENPNYKDVDGVLYSKNETRLCSYPRLKGNGEGYIVLPSVSTIDADAFYHSSIPHVVLPSLLTYIKMGTFANSRIKDITIPSTVKVIDRGAFYNCTNLKSMFFMPKTPPVIGMPNVNSVLYTGADGVGYDERGEHPFVNMTGCTLYTQCYSSTSWPDIDVASEVNPVKYYDVKYDPYINISTDKTRPFTGVVYNYYFTIPESGYMTVARDFDIKFHDESAGELTPYAVSAFDPTTGTVTLTKFVVNHPQLESGKSERYVPARLLDNDGYYHSYYGVIVKGTPGKKYRYILTRNDYTTAAEERISLPSTYKNLVYPNLVETYREPEYQNTYKFVLNGGKIRRVTKAGILGYNKAYLRLSKLQVEQMYANGLGAKGLNVVFEDGETTTIEYAKTNIASKEDNKYYNLSGQCVENPTKGIYIKNGKKIVIK